MTSSAQSEKPARPFPWTDRYLMGFKPMDDTHREFVEVVDALLGAEDADMAARLEAFAAHARRHFEEERVWMEETGFPARECHNDEHAAVMKSVLQVQEIVAAGKAAEARSLAIALKDWFPGHADYMDASLSQWMCKKKLGGTPVVLRRNILDKQKA